MKNYMFAILLILLLSGCADAVSISQNPDIGFWYGFWHGIILPFAWLCSLFDNSIAIYAVHNNGGWYNFGFALGIGALGSSSHSHRKSK